MSNYKRLISQILLSCFIFSVIPTQVLAETLNNGAYVEPQFNTEEEDSSKCKKRKFNIYTGFSRAKVTI